MDRLFVFVQFCLSVLLFLCFVIGCAGNVIVGSISGVIGYAFVAVVVWLVGCLVRESWKEYKRSR